jgi:hypothetical protein
MSIQSDDGRRVISRARRIVYRIERRMVADLDAREQERFREWLVLCAKPLVQ